MQEIYVDWWTVWNVVSARLLPIVYSNYITSLVTSLLCSYPLAGSYQNKVPGFNSAKWRTTEHTFGMATNQCSCTCRPKS